MTVVSAEHLLNKTIYRSVLESVDKVIQDLPEGDDEAAISVYLSLRLITKAMEDEMGIKEVEVINE